MDYARASCKESAQCQSPHSVQRLQDEHFAKHSAKYGSRSSMSTQACMQLRTVLSGSMMTASMASAPCLQLQMEMN